MCYITVDAISAATSIVVVNEPAMKVGPFCTEHGINAVNGDKDIYKAHLNYFLRSQKQAQKLYDEVNSIGLLASETEFKSLATCNE